MCYTKIMNTKQTFQVRNMATDETTGWAARAYAMGLKVSSRAGNFGDEISFVKKNGAAIQVVQNSRNGRKLDASVFTPEQLAIVADLRTCGLIA